MQQEFEQRMEIRIREIERFTRESALEEARSQLLSENEQILE